jgi:hypothetical protein
MIKYSDLVAGLVGGTNGQVLFNDNDTIAGAANLFWDNTNGRLGIGYSTIATPTAKLEIRGSGSTSATTSLLVQNSANASLFSVRDDGNAIVNNSLSVGGAVNTTGFNQKIRIIGQGDSALGIYRNQESTFGAKLEFMKSRGTYDVPLIVNSSDILGSIGFFGYNGTSYINAASISSVALSTSTGVEGDLRFTVWNNTGGNVNTMRATKDGVGIGNALDYLPSARLQIRGAGTTSATTALLLQNSLSTELFRVRDDGNIGIGTATPTFRLEVQGGDVRFANGLTIGTAGSAGWQFSSNTVTLIQNGIISVDFVNGREFSFTNASFLTTYLKLASVTGNVLINTTTDSGFRLDVNGTARINTLTIGLGTGQIATNTVLGNLALNSNTTGIRNVAIGQNALSNNTTGSFNIAIGRNALNVNTTNSNNTAVGNDALANAQADGNTAIGSSALQSATGSNNTAVGFGSLDTNTTGERNTAIGQGSSSGNFSGSVILGRLATATANNQFVVGSSTTNAGSVTTEVNTSTQVWNVVINGVARKILLA